jgi:hypothetical protein
VMNALSPVVGTVWVVVPLMTQSAELFQVVPLAPT